MLQVIHYSWLRYGFFKLLQKTVTEHVQIRITTKRGNAILISGNDYESILETAQLLSILDLKESIERADKEITNSKIFLLEEIFE